MDRYDLWRLLMAPRRRRDERKRRAAHEADIRGCIDACKQAEREREHADRVARRILTFMSDELDDTPEPNRITMEATAHPLPDVPTQAEMDAAITWMIYLTNHEHGPTVRYGTVEL